MVSSSTGSLVVEVRHGEWDALLERLGIADAYLRLGWLSACALIEGGEPVLLHASGDGGDVVCALLLRDVPACPGLRDATTPYGYGGPIAVGAAAPIERFQEGFGEWCSARDVISVFMRFHPLYANERLAPPGAEVIKLAGTIAWRLDGGRDLEASMHARHRRSVRTARRDGVEVAVHAPPASLARFIPLYEQTMRRQDASPFYFFNERYWEQLSASFRDEIVLVEATLEGELAASLLCIATEPFLHYHLGASSDAGRRAGASNLCFLEAARWGQQRGLTHLHLGGGVGGSEDSLYGFKHRFDPDLGARDAYIGKLVTDEERYRDAAGTVSTAGFFPAYRAPAPA